MRKQHLGILISALPSLDVLYEGILNVDKNILDTDKLQMILSKFPTNEEIMSIKEFEKSLYAKQDGKDRKKIEWDGPEEFCLMTDKISNIKIRLNSWVYINTFIEEYENLYDSLSVYNKGCIELYTN